MEEILATLVSMRTIPEDIAANDTALDYIEQYLARRGMHIQRFRYDGRGSLVATTQPKSKNPAVMLTAHVDVVHGSDKVFSLRKADGKLYGRGVFDMKFAIAAYLQLVDEIAEQLDQYDFGIMITSDEELGGVDDKNGVDRLVQLEGYRPGVVVLPDGGDDWKIEELAKGFWRFELIAKGKTAHSSRPWEGENAAFKLVHALHDLRLQFKDHGPHTDTLNFGTIHGGTMWNQIPDHMAAGVEIRLMHDRSLARWQREVNAICQKHDIHYETDAIVEPYTNSLHDPRITPFLASIEAITGKPSGGCISYAATDGPYFGAVGIPCIITRPPGGKHHSEGEWIDEQGFLQLKPILRHFLDSTARTKTNAVQSVDRTPALV